MFCYSYIVLEGIDGAGKTLQLKKLAKYCERRAVTPIKLFEPTYGQYGIKARQMMAASQLNERRSLHELFVRDRKEHVRKKIIPLLDFVRAHDGFALLQDRCYFSAPAYQGTNKHDAIKLLQEEQKYAPKPDIIVLLRVAPKLAMERLRMRARDNYLIGSTEVLSSIQDRYEMVAHGQNENVAIVDGNGSEQEVHSQVLAALENSNEPANF